MNYFSKKLEKISFFLEKKRYMNSSYIFQTKGNRNNNMAIYLIFLI